MAETTEPQAERTDTNPKDTSTFWQVQLGLADKDQQDWEKDGRAVVARYRAEHKSAVKRDTRWFNILFSNTETLKSTLYGKTAKPDVRRRFADKDPNAREAAEIIERSLIYCADQYDVDKCIEPAIHDYLLPGRGVIRIEYEPIIKERPMLDPMTAQPVMGEGGKPVMKEFIADQVVRERYVYWEDYRQNPARIWDDIWWVAFRHVMSREDLRENKFESVEKIPLNWMPGTDDKRPVPDELKKAEVWEIWDKSRKKRLWIVKGYERPLRIDDDPYGLEGFFPLPEPILSVPDTQTLVPRPEYFEYKDQADDLDEIVGRISRLTRALKRRGVYDQAVKELKRLATAGDNQFIPVENWQALSSKGGLQAAFQTEDISVIAVVLKELYLQRDMLVQGIYELTGIADIMRGSSDPNETLGAQELKAQFGSTRIKRRQRAVQKWIRDIYKIKAEIMAEHFEPQALQKMTGVQVTPEVMQILRSDKLRGYRIDIETDSTVFEDEAGLKQQTVEMLTAASTFMDKAVPAIQAAPELAPLAFEMFEVGVRVFKRGRAIEDVIEQTKQAVMQKVAQAQNNPQLSPEQQKAQAEAQRIEMQAQADKEEAERKRVEGEQEMARKEREGQLNAAQMEMEFGFRERELELRERELELKTNAMESQQRHQAILNAQELQHATAMAQIEKSDRTDKARRDREKDENDERRAEDEHQTKKADAAKPKVTKVNRDGEGRMAELITQ